LSKVPTFAYGNKKPPCLFKIFVIVRSFYKYLKKWECLKQEMFLKSFNEIGRVVVVNHDQGTCWAQVIGMQTQQTVQQVVETFQEMGNGPYASKK
jgi:hypothetical protein